MADDDELHIPDFLRRNKPQQTLPVMADTKNTSRDTTAIANLPALIERAAARLLESKSSAEVLEAKQLAEAAQHYARVTKAAGETQADCLRIITRAETRMADEVDAAQELGQLSRPGGNRSKVRTADFGGAGLDKRRVNEWRAVRDAGEQFVEDILRGALAEGRTPTKREIVDGAKAVRQELKGRAATSCAKGEDTRRRPVRGRATRGRQREQLMRVHWAADATSETIARALLAKLEQHPQHLALCEVLRTFLDEHGAR